MEGKIVNPLSLWNYQENSGIWVSENGSFVKLGPIEVRRLSYIEQKELRYIALNRLNHSGLGITISLPKDYKRRRANLNRMLGTEKIKDVRVEKEDFPVFGTSLQSVVEKEWDAVDQFEVDSDCQLINELDNRRHSLSFSRLLLDDNDHRIPHPNSFFIDALSLNNLQDTTEKESSREYGIIHVPNLISRCCKFIIEKGLYTEGIFRIPASKKRIIELKEQINYSGQVTFDKNTNVHEVAGLIKEYLRELPEPLLTKELYEAFLAISKLFHREQIRTLQLLVNVLPGYNRDTLYTLLSFLNLIHSRSKSSVDSATGQNIVGNKMDSKNLAIVFAPNILRKSMKEGACTKEKSDMAADVVKVMIDEYEEIFRISSKLHNETIKAVAMNSPEYLDLVLFYKIQHGCGLFSCRLNPHDKSILENLNLRPLFERCNHISTKANQAYNLPLMAQRSLASIGRNVQAPVPSLVKPISRENKEAYIGEGKIRSESTSIEHGTHEANTSTAAPFKKYIRSKTAPLKQLKRFLTQSSPHIPKFHEELFTNIKQKSASSLEINESF